jgi:ketosteroid isomerase-like protein
MRHFLLVLLCAFSWGARADEGGDLFHDIKAADAKFFDAFNNCDLKTMSEMFAKDLEFYHDLGGLHGYKDTMETTRENCNKRLGLRRKVVDGSLKVYPVPGYGAMELGTHSFCHVENGKNDCGTFEFVHLWRRSAEGEWKLARVVSYGH